MKNILITLSSLLLISFSSCTRFITPPVTGQNNIGYIPRPFYKDSTTSITNVSLGYDVAQSKDGHLQFEAGVININRGHTYKQFNFGYGLFADLGKAIYNDTLTNKNYPNDPAVKSFRLNFNNLGLRTTIGYQIISDNGKTNFRVINWENAFSVENGSYKDYRDSLFKQNITETGIRVYVSNLSRFYTTGLSSEIIKNNAFGTADLQVSLRLFIGGTFNLGNSFRNITDRNLSDAYFSRACITASYYLKYKRMMGSLQIGNDVNFGSKIALGYTF